MNLLIRAVLFCLSAMNLTSNMSLLRCSHVTWWELIL